MSNPVVVAVDFVGRILYTALRLPSPAKPIFLQIVVYATHGTKLAVNLEVREFGLGNELRLHGLRHETRHGAVKQDSPRRMLQPITARNQSL
jgi:hypothetical protein